MAESYASALRGRRRPTGRFLVRTARRTVVESLYLLTAPVLAVAGLVLALVGLGVGTAVALVRGGSPVAAGMLAPARWLADLERWRIGLVRPATGASAKASERASANIGSDGRLGADGGLGSEGGVWFEVAHPVVVLPVAMVTSVMTGMWWAVGLAAGTASLRAPFLTTGRMEPMTLSTGGGQSHIDLSLGLTSPAARLTFGTVLGLVLLATLPLVTRACVAVQAGLGEALLSDASALHRRIRGLEQERDTARAQTVAAVTAEASALRRLERDIHDGPQQRLVRLAMELGRAQRHLDARPDAARAALADAIVQAREALEELRALSRGIAPPVLADRGLRAALAALAARSTVPVEIDVDLPDVDLPDVVPEDVVLEDVALEDVVLKDRSPTGRAVKDPRRSDVDPRERRLAPAVETAAYFVIAEALTNVAKHSDADRCGIRVRQRDGNLLVRITDDGVGGAALAKGHGLRGLDDRVRAIGGRLTVTSPRGGPTTIEAELPCP